MKLSDYLAKKDSQKVRKSVRCNALYKTGTSFNCNLTPIQAIEHARHVLEKAQLILDNGIEDAVVQVWNAGQNSRTLSCGLTIAVKKARRNANRSHKTARREE